MLESYLRPHFQAWFLDACTRFLSRRLHCTANKITILAGIVGFLVIPALYFDHSILAALLIFSSGLLDIFDGALARLEGVESAWGGFLDVLMDRVVESCILVGLCVKYPQHVMLTTIMLASILVCVTSFLLAGIFTQNQGNKSFYYSPGLIERAEAFIFFIAMVLLPSYFDKLSITFIVLVLLTTLLRVLQARKHLLGL